MSWALEPALFGAHDLNAARRIGAAPFLGFFVLRSV
jgi:hypothetical protein